MNLDRGRQYDLEELEGAYRSAPNRYWRDHYEKIMDRILRESGEVREIRQQMIEAFRANDKRAKQYLGEKMRQVRLNETYGHRDH